MIICIFLLIFLTNFNILFIYSFQIVPEKPIELQIKLCSHNLKPYFLDTMLFFPPDIKFCVTLNTSKGSVALIKDTRRTTFLQPIISTVIREIGSSHQCKINFMGYGSEYRLAPDYGYYAYCQKLLSQYTNQLINKNGTIKNSLLPALNISNPNCPILSLPNLYTDLLSCNLYSNKWYELQYKSSIQYEIYIEKYYHQFWSNYSTTFFFKTEKIIERAGPELYWLQRLVKLDVKLSKNCKIVRYLLNVDDDWPLQMRVFIDYQIRENKYIKHLQHIGNGTLDKWFSGAFIALQQNNQIHEVCAQLVWQESQNRFRLCRVFTQPKKCFNFSFGSNGSATLLLTNFCINYYIINILSNLLFINFYFFYK